MMKPLNTGKVGPDIAADTGGFQALSEAIILQAVKDFETSWLRLKRRRDDREATAAVKEITSFFCGDFFAFLTDLDGPTLLERLIKKLDKGKGIK